MRRILSLVPVLGLTLLVRTASANFHLMQIDEIIGGVEGDPTAQAIVLRLRSAGQTFVSSARLVAWDSSGANPIVLLDMTTNVSSGAAGSDILLATPAFNALMSGVAGYSSDFTLAHSIPANYLDGGKITFQGDDGTVYWSTAFGNYTGANTGSTSNDADGNFGAPFGSSLPAGSLEGIQFTGPATAASTTNAVDYEFTNNPATVTNNHGATFTVVPEPGALGLLSFGAVALGGLLYRRRCLARKSGAGLQ